MKPAPFRYVAPGSIDEVLALLAERGQEAKVLAGGQSLVPMMNFRLVRPAWLIDLNRVAGLAGIATANGSLVIGSMTRQTDVEASADVKKIAPLLHEAVPFIGHGAIRNRGTVGGSLAHADPAAELPLAMLALDAIVQVRGPRGSREIPADAFFVSILTTALEADEIVTAVRVPACAAGAGWAFVEFARRHGDFALVAVATTFRLQDGAIKDPIRVALGGTANRPIHARRAEATLRGAPPSREVFQAAAALAAGEADPPSDLHGSADYRRHLVAVLVEEALERASLRATSVGTSAHGSRG